MQIVPQLLSHYIVSKYVQSMYYYGRAEVLWEDPYPCHVLLKVTKTPA